MASSMKKSIMNTTHTQNWNIMYSLFSRKFTPLNVSAEMNTIRSIDRMMIIHRSMSMKYLLCSGVFPSFMTVGGDGWAYISTTIRRGRYGFCAG